MLIYEPIDHVIYLASPFNPRSVGHEEKNEKLKMKNGE